MVNQRVTLIRAIKEIDPKFKSSRFDNIISLTNKLNLVKSLKNVNKNIKINNYTIDNLITLAGVNKAYRNPITGLNLTSQGIKKFLTAGFKLGVNNLDTLIKYKKVKINDDESNVFLERKTLNAYNGFIFVYEDNNEDIKTYTGKATSAKSIFNVINMLRYENEDNFRAIEYRLFKLQTDRLYDEFGAAYKGVGNCVFTALKSMSLTNFQKHQIDILSKDFQDGVFKDDYETIAKELKIRIKVHVNDKTFEFNAKSKKKAYNLYFYNNHVVSKLDDKKETIRLDKIKLDSNIVDKIVNIKVDGDEILYLETIDTKYMLKTQTIGTKTYTIQDSLTAVSDYKKLFINKNDIFHFSGEDSKYFCKHGNQLLKSKYRVGKTIDLKRAYNNFMNFPCYDGMPFSIDIVCKDVDVDLVLKNYAGFGLCVGINPFTLVEETRWMSIPLIKHRLNNGYSLKFLKWCLSHRKGDYDMTMFDGEDKRLWQHVVGSMSRCITNKSLATTDYVLAKSYGLNGDFSHEDTKIYYGTYDEEFTKNYSFVSAYVQQYTEIMMEEMYFKLDDKKIWAVYVDGISLVGDVDFSYDTNLWDVKFNKAHNKTMEHSDSFIDLNERELEYNLDNCVDFVDILVRGHNRIKIINGSPGTGKSTLIKKFNKSYGWPILVQSNLQKSIYSNAMTVDYYITKGLHDNTVLIDEYYMMDSNKLAYFKNAILVGDNNQLAISSNIINYKKFDFIELTKIYRYDLMTKEIVDSVLKRGIISTKLQKKSIKYCLENNIQILAPTHEDIKKINKIGLSMNIDKKVRFCKTNLKDDIYCGDMGIVVKNGILNLRNNIIYKLSVGSYDSDSLVKYSFALTYHSAQGMEFSKIGCYYKKVDRKLLYVGFSRVKHYSNIYSICGLE